MAQFEPYRDEIAKAESQVMFIAAEKGEGFFHPRRFFEKHPISFPFLLDEDRAVTKAYGLYHRLGLDAFNIAHPATLVIGRDRTARYIYRGDSQTDRAPLNEVMDAMKKAS